jgi:hypothetical protein
MIFTAVASPQPGTTNTPVPAPPIPAFIPVVVTGDSDLSTVTTDQLVALILLIEKSMVYMSNIYGMPGNMPAIENDIYVLAKTTSSVLDLFKTLQTSISDMNESVIAMAAAKGVNSAMIAPLIANQIRTNNFMMSVRDEQPEMPSAKDQFLSNVKDSTIALEVATAQAASQNFVNTSFIKLQTWITGTETYQGVVEALKKAKDSVIGFFDSAATKIKNLFVSSGIKGS